MINLYQCEENLKEQFKRIEDIAMFNTKKVLKAFQDNRVSTQHFAPTTGYGYDDLGRDCLSKLFAQIFNSEDAIVSPLITCGSHALSLALFALLRPHDNMISISSNPYDTLMDSILSKDNEDLGTLQDFNINYSQIELKNGSFDKDEIIKQCKLKNPKVIFIQRSRGYTSRSAFSCQDISNICELIKRESPNSIIVVDNCYGEFVEKIEPCECGADLIIGSMIKNPGGGLAPTGAYFAGKKDIIKKVAARLTSPSLLTEVGSYAHGYREFYQGLFIAPTVVLNAIKGAYLIGEVMNNMGYKCFPNSDEPTFDIIKSIIFNNSSDLIKFVQTIQQLSPVDSYVTPLPWDMPGYQEQVIMAAGTFVSGASIELSCDSPIKEPFIAYFQGSLTYEHAKIVAQYLIENFKN